MPPTLKKEIKESLERNGYFFFSNSNGETQQNDVNHVVPPTTYIQKDLDYLKKCGYIISFKYPPEYETDCEINEFVNMILSFLLIGKQKRKCHWIEHKNAIEILKSIEKAEPTD